MKNNKKINLPDAKSLQDYVSGFLFNEDTAKPDPVIPDNSTDSGRPTEDIKDTEETLQDSMISTKNDIDETKKKIEELNKVISITTDTLKRNYLMAQLKEKKDSLLKKNELMKNQQDNLKKQQEEKNKPGTENSVVKAVLGTDSQNGSTAPASSSSSSSSSSASASLNMEVANIRQMVNELINKKMMKPIQNKPAPVAAPAPIAAPQPVKRRSFKVVFDKSSKPWEVVFSERGFLVGGTRLSFENIEVALDKKFNISLDNGQGLVLDPIKMNKILKYKDKV